MEKLAPGPQCRALHVPGGPMPLPALPQHARPRSSWGALPEEGAEERCCQGLPSRPSLCPQIQPRGEGQAGCRGSGCPPNGASQGCDPLCTHRKGALLGAEPRSFFSRGFGPIFSPCYGTWCRMAASELFGFLIGGVDVKAKCTERKYQQPPWGHPAKPGGDSRARCELSWHVFVSATRGIKRISGLNFCSGLAFSFLAVLIVLLHPLLAKAENCIFRCCWSVFLFAQAAESF